MQVPLGRRSDIDMSFMELVWLKSWTAEKLESSFQRILSQLGNNILEFDVDEAGALGYVIISEQL